MMNEEDDKRMEALIRMKTEPVVLLAPEQEKLWREIVAKRVLRVTKPIPIDE